MHSGQNAGAQGASARDEYFRRLELVVQHTTNMVVVTNQRREIEWVNPAYTSITGWTLDEVRGKNPRTFLHGPRTNQSAASRLGGLLRNGQQVKDFEMLNYKKSGEPYWVSLSIQPIVDAQGQIREYVAIQSDVTDRKRKEQETVRLLRRLDEAQRIARLGNMEHDLTSGIVHCSAEIFRIIDADQAEADGEATYEDLMACTHPDDVALVKTRYEEAVNNGGPYESEHRVLSRTGRVKWVHMRGVLEGWDDGTPALCRLVVQDITDRKEAEQIAQDKRLLLQASRTQMEVLSRVSHELRTPLHAVLGFAEMVERLESSRLCDRSKAHLRHIRDSARHLLLIVNDILDLTRLQSGRVPFRIQPVDLSAVARDVAALLEPMSAESGVRVSVASSITPAAALADRQRLVQILVNLIGNAIKYNRRGGRVVVQFKRTAGSRIQLAVEDTGIGIDARHLGHLFEPFFRVAGDNADAPAQGSSGLGLAISKSLAQSMGGDIRVESTLGTGSVFVLELPSSRPAEAIQAPLAQAPPCPEDTAHPSGTLLYIEDNEINCAVIEGYLQARPDIQLHCRASGEAGLQAARELRPSLILVDMHLPDMSGHDVMEAILDDPALHRTPCIAFSADAGEDEIEAAIRSGFREYLTKPAGPSDFLEMIDRLIDAEPLATRL